MPVSELCAGAELVLRLGEVVPTPNPNRNPRPLQLVLSPFCGPSSTRCAPSSRAQLSSFLGPAFRALSLFLQPPVLMT